MADHPIRRSRPTFSIVIETANLETADAALLFRSLDSIAAQDPSPEAANECIVLDGGHADSQTIQQILDRYPFLRIRRIDSGTTYGDQKAVAVEETTGELIVFADSDCTYTAGWLASYLDAAAENPSLGVFAGETSLLVHGPYTLAMAFVFFFPRPTGDVGIHPARGFYGNNAAFRRNVLLECPFPRGLPVYRGQNVIYSRYLRRAGLAIARVPASLSWHAPPAGVVAAIQRLFLTGRDTPRLRTIDLPDSDAPYQGDFEPYHHPGGRFRKVWIRLQQVARQQPAMLLWLPLAAPVAAACILAFFAGVGAELFSAKWRSLPSHSRSRHPA